MPIKPVDFQIMVTRTLEASKNQNNDFSKLLNVQKVTKATIQQEADKGLRQVQHRDKMYKSNVDKDGKGNRNYEQDEGREHHEEHHKNETDSNDSKTSAQSSAHIDIKI